MTPKSKDAPKGSAPSSPGASVQKSRASWPAIVALPVSLLSLAVSGATPYYNYFAAFAPLVTVGGPVFQFDKAAPTNLDAARGSGPEFDPVSGRVIGAILLPVIVTHEGGRPGVVTDVMVRVSRRGQADRWLFEPRVYVDERAFISAFDPQALVKSIEAVFSPIPLAKGSQTRRLIMFQWLDHPLFPGGRLRVGGYRLDVLALISGEDEYREVERFDIDFGAQVLSNLEENMRYAPTPDSFGPPRARLK